MKYLKIKSRKNKQTKTRRNKQHKSRRNKQHKSRRNKQHKSRRGGCAGSEAVSGSTPASTASTPTIGSNISNATSQTVNKMQKTIADANPQQAANETKAYQEQQAAAETKQREKDMETERIRIMKEKDQQKSTAEVAEKTTLSNTPATPDQDITKLPWIPNYISRQYVNFLMYNTSNPNIIWNINNTKDGFMLLNIITITGQNVDIIQPNEKCTDTINTSDNSVTVKCTNNSGVFNRFLLLNKNFNITGEISRSNKMSLYVLPDKRVNKLSTFIEKLKNSTLVPLNLNGGKKTRNYKSKKRKTRRLKR